MAITIKSIPILEKEVAQRFTERADASYVQKHKIDFRKQVNTAKSILKKAKMR